MGTPSRCTGAVVIIEDEEDARELLREILEGRGYAVSTAEDGIKALELLRRTPSICLVILDLIMPRMDGFDVLKALADDPRLSSVPLYISTSSPDRAPSGWPCLPKPIDVNRLLSLVDEHCQQIDVS